MLRERIYKSVSLINLFSALALICLLPVYYSKPQFYFTLIFFVSYLFEFVLDKRWTKFSFKPHSWIFISFILFYLLGYFYFPLEQNISHLSKIQEIRLPFLALGVIGLFGINKYYKLSYFGFAVIASSLFLIIYLLFYQIGIHEFVISPHKSNLFAYARMFSVNSHMIFNYYLNVGLIFVYYFLFQSPQNFSKLFKSIIAFSGLILFSILFISEGRMGFILAILIILIILYYKISDWNKIIAIIVSLLLLSLSSIIILNHPRFIENKPLENPRIVIWNVSLDLIKENPILGIGASTAAERMIDKLDESESIKKCNDVLLNNVISERRILNAHSHNQFLQTTIEFGVLGLIVLLFLNLSPLFFARKEIWRTVFFLVLITVGQLLTDIYFSGVTPLTYCLLIVLFIRVDDAENQDLIGT